MIPDIYSNPSGAASGASGNPYAPGYIPPYNVDDVSQRVVSSSAHGQNILGASKGAIIAPNTQDIPFPVFTGNISNYGKLPSTPVLLYFVRSYGVDVPLTESESSASIYKKIRERLPPNLRKKLDYDEQQEEENRDPDLIALDESMHFAADFIQKTTQLAAAVNLEHPTIKAGIGLINAMANDMENNTYSFVNEVKGYMHNHLDTIGRNDPSYDILSNSLQLLDDALKAGVTRQFPSQEEKL